MRNMEFNSNNKLRLRSLEDIYTYVKQQQFFSSNTETKKAELKLLRMMMGKILKDLNILLYEKEVLK